MRGFYGCRPDDPAGDAADHKFALSWLAPRSSIAVPATINLGAWLPPPMYQGPQSTCVPHTMIAAIRFDRISNGLPDIELSRLFPYFRAGQAEQDTTDDGRQPRDVAAALQQYGTCREDLWPYDPNRIMAEPTPQAVSDAFNFKVIDMQSVKTDDVSTSLAMALGKPVCVSFPVFKQFESDECAATGLVDMPGLLDSAVGYHSMLAFARGVAGGRDAAMNWWTPPDGPPWGFQGSDELPSGCALFAPGYWSKLGTDFWVLNSALEGAA
jgi:hypothetical protein